MGTVYDYLTWRGDLTFWEAPFNEVDSLIFSELSYLNMQGIVPESHTEGSVPIQAAANSFLARNTNLKQSDMGVLIPLDIVKMMRALKETRRFKNVEMRNFVNVIDRGTETQFSAITFLLGEGTAVVTFRGTDDSLVGWKEDMNMCFMPEVPAQALAVQYLTHIANTHPGSIITAGHSKGGNLAVYAAVHCEEQVRDRIVQIYSNDGPGFGTNILDDPVYLEVRPRIRSLVPQSSIVGMLLEHDENYTVVKSRQKTGFLQHNGLSWEILGNSFVHLKEVTPDSRRVDRTVNRWIKEMTPAQREEFAEAVYQIFSVDGAETLTELVAARKKWFSHSKQLDPKVHETVQKMMSQLIGFNAKNALKGILRKNQTAD